MGSREDQARWDDKYAVRPPPTEPKLNPRLARYFALLTPGLALDLAGGIGVNAQFLKGYQVVLLDISERALERAQGMRVLADAAALPFSNETFNTVICTYFFDPNLDLTAILKPGGTLFLETFTLAERKYRPDFPSHYCLDSKQLDRILRGMMRVLWEETDDGRHVIGTLIGRKHS